jgi:hypothetical protein
MGDQLFRATKSVSSFALACPSIAQNNVDREQEGFVGPVREVRLKCLRSFKVAWLVSIERKIPLRMISFNAIGNKTKVVSYDPANAGNDQTEVYRYDSGGRKIERI